MSKTSTALLPEALRHGHFFSLPNEIFELELSPSAFLVYSYLRRSANRRTRQCYPSYSTIGETVGLSRNTVQKCVCELVDKGLIATEDTSVIRNGMKGNGNLLYTVLPVHDAVDAHHQRQLRRLEAERAVWERSKKWDGVNKRKAAKLRTAMRGAQGYR